MKIFGVNIIYDEKETIYFREQFKDSIPPKKLSRLRAYEITNEFDGFRKYRCAFSLLGVFFRIYLFSIWRLVVRHL